MIKITEEYREAAKRFKEHFGYGVPLSMIPQVAATDDIINRINLCIEQDKDNLLESFGVSENDEVLY